MPELEASRDCYMRGKNNIIMWVRSVAMDWDVFVCFPDLVVGRWRLVVTTCFLLSHIGTQHRDAWKG